MILAFDTTERVSDFPAGVHPQDLSVRPQVLERSWNPGFYDLLCCFQQQTGRSVESPWDACDVFNRSGLSHLAIGRLLLRKN